MTRPAQIFAMCAPPGFEEFLSGVGIVFVLGLLAFVSLAGYFLVRDFYRFGQRGFSWLVALIGSCVFSVGGYILAGPVGTAVSAPMLIAFGLGKHKARASLEETSNDKSESSG